MSTSPKSITLPPCDRHPKPTNHFTAQGPLVIVGANGSGKSRLAWWIERKHPLESHRVSAQRSLSFPDDYRGTSIDRAEGALLYGHETFTSAQVANKFSHRWGHAHDRQLDDFQKLVTLLFSESAQVREEYLQLMSAQTSHTPPPVRKLDVIKKIWDEILPNRELLIGGHKIEAKKRGASDSFSPHEMSDGERVIFYLIGQCLCAPKDGIVIIDEPELHLHRALQTKLWDSVEKARSDCFFVYITHDLDFSASRKGKISVWLSEYQGGEKWDWDFVPDNVPLPEALWLEIVGSRRPVLLVEGKDTDERIYRLLYPDLHVLSFGGCEQIIHATASCRALKKTGQVNEEVFGLVDRDGRSNQDMANLNKTGVAVLEWSEIENLLLSPDAVLHVSTALHRDADADLNEITGRVLELFAREAARVTCELAGRQLDRSLREWNWKQKDEAALQSALDAHLKQIDSNAVIAGWQSQIQFVIKSADYDAALRLYPNKGLLNIAGRILGLTDYEDYVVRRICSPEGAPLLKLLRTRVPTIS